MDLQLQNKLALVTGSTASIGFAIAETLAREGARVIINGRTQEGVDAALAKLAPYDAVGCVADLGTAAGADLLVKQFPAVDILVNNLGIYDAKPFDAISDDDWTHFFEVNVMSGVRLARAYLPAMKQSNWGRIIFISSESAVNIPDVMIHYSVTKASQIVIARGLAQSVAGTGITVNSVLPGPTHSRGTEDFLGRALRNGDRTREEIEAVFIAKERPTSIIGRFAHAQEVASLVAYVASPLASATTGAALRVEGGILQSAF
jgi:NAD(P)-dependent dehydrogenase (short-subunit alcohol dehydrogenase family)